MYKMKNEYVITLIDKESFFTKHVGSYLSISQNKSSELAKLLCKSTIYDKKKPFEILKEIVHLSNEKRFMPLNIRMKKQSIGNCAVSEVEATVKTALFHCRIDMFKLASSTPVKWNDLPSSTLEMRRQFANVILGKDPEWDVILKRVIRIYELRKKIKQALKFSNDEADYRNLATIKKIFFKDPIIQSANNMSIKNEFIDFYKLSKKLNYLDEQVTSLNEIMKNIAKKLEALKNSPINDSTKLNKKFTKETKNGQNILNEINKIIVTEELLAPLKGCTADNIQPAIIKIKKELVDALAQMNKKIPVAMKEINKKTKKMNALLVEIEKEIVKINNSQTSSRFFKQSTKQATSNLKGLKQKIEGAKAIDYSKKNPKLLVSEKDQGRAFNRLS